MIIFSHTIDVNVIHGLFQSQGGHSPQVVQPTRLRFPTWSRSCRRVWWICWSVCRSQAPWVRRTAAPASPPRGRMDGTSKGRGELGMITVKKIYGDNDEHCMKIYGNYMEICGNWMKFLNYQNIQDNSSMIAMWISHIFSTPTTLSWSTTVALDISSAHPSGRAGSTNTRAKHRSCRSPWLKFCPFSSTCGCEVKPQESWFILWFTHWFTNWLTNYRVV